MGAARIVFELLTTTWIFYTEGDPSKPLESMAQIIGAAREAGAFGFLPYGLANQAELLCRGRGVARSSCVSPGGGRDRARYPQSHLLAGALVNLARTEAVMGHDEECLAHLFETHEIARALELGSTPDACARR